MQLKLCSQAGSKKPADVARKEARAAFMLLAIIGMLMIIL